MTTLPIPTIRLDGGTQPRASLSDRWISEYAEDMRNGSTFPPVTVFYDGTDHWLADGFHRTHAAMSLGQTEIDCDVRQGTVRNAILYSVSANGIHGQRRTNEDKRRAVQTLLNDAEWGAWSDSEIARRCGVSHPFVGALRPGQTCNGYKSEPRTFVHPKSGKETQMKTAAIGSASKGSAPRPRRSTEPSSIASIAARPPELERLTVWLSAGASFIPALGDPQTIAARMSEHGMFLNRNQVATIVDFLSNLNGADV